MRGRDVIHTTEGVRPSRKVSDLDTRRWMPGPELLRSLPLSGPSFRDG